MKTDTTEKGLEAHITQHLCLKDAFEERHHSQYNRVDCVDEDLLFNFLQTTQEKEVMKLQSIHGSNYRSKVLYRLNNQIKTFGIIEVLRKGITDNNIKHKLFFDKPVSSLNEKDLALYNQNIFSVTRQVHYSNLNENSLDLVVFINGLPIITFELKNELTKQTVKDAIKQYKANRDPKEELFRLGRCLVHFAVDTEQVWMATHLKGENTYFLPFNKGNNNGAGNPHNPNGIKTDYLWKDILTKDRLTNIIQNYVQLFEEETEKILPDGKVKKEKVKKLIFPRYHQIDAVDKLLTNAKENGAGKRYLIQHSAGSGKSNSISWLAHQLVGLFDKNNENTVFDTVIVVTDRKVLDAQIRNNIKQFEQVKGVVEAITEGSKQLKTALEEGKKIIITTIQKFPYIVNEIGELPGNKFGIIIDEAHSSQSGNTAGKLNETLAKDFKKVQVDDDEFVFVDKDQYDELTSEDLVVHIVKGRKMLTNASYFAFTATPKNKTLQLFGKPYEEGDQTKYEAFDLYSMKQAIEEGFILDVLKYYMTYKMFFRLNKAIEEDPLLNKKKASSAIGRFVSLHPHNLAQKTEVIIEHFRQVTMKKIGGRAKAMVVTGSRLHALRYYFEFKKYIKENKYEDIRPLVAFSGKVIDSEFPDGVSEPQLNGFGEKELPVKFDTDEYRILLVADKYQTGFDQPLLHTMYVDKKLSGVKAVQTLSRLNRTCPGKEDTFVLDFANDQDTIFQSFQPYYELTTLKENTDPNHLYDLKGRLDAAQVYQWSEVNAFAEVFFKKEEHNARDQAKLYSWIDPAKDRFKALEEPKQDEFKKALTSFVRLYSFLSQILPFQDVELEKLYAYGRLLLIKLPKTDYIERLKLDNDVALEYYRLQKMSENSITLQPKGEVPLNTTTEAGISRPKDERAKLSEIIDVLNDRFGTDFDKADKLFFDQIEEELFNDETLKQQAMNNDIDNFKYGFEEVFIHKLIDRMDDNQKIFDKVMDSSDFKKTVQEWLLKKLYKRFNDDDKK